MPDRPQRMAAPPRCESSTVVAFRVDPATISRVGVASARLPLIRSSLSVIRRSVDQRPLHPCSGPLAVPLLREPQLRDDPFQGDCNPCCREGPRFLPTVPLLVLFWVPSVPGGLCKTILAAPTQIIQHKRPIQHPWPSVTCLLGVQIRSDR